MESKLARYLRSAQQVLSEVDSVSQQTKQMDNAVSEFQTR